MMRCMRYRIAALTAVLIFAYSAPTQARTPYTDALKVAAEYWASSPEGSFPLACNGQPSLVMRELEPSMNPLAIAWTSHGTCTIYVRTSFWVNERNEQVNFLDFCQTIVHENGHLILPVSYFAASDPTNPDHSTDPTNVMYPTGTAYNTPTGCYKYAHYWEKYANYVPSAQADVPDELVDWRTVTVRPHTVQHLVCASTENLQTKLWIMSGNVNTSRIAPNVLRLTNHSSRTAIVRGACEPNYGLE